MQWICFLLPRTLSVFTKKCFSTHLQILFPTKASHKLWNFSYLQPFAWFSHQHCQCWWGRSSRCAVVLTAGGFPAIRIQWSQLAAIATGRDHTRKALQAGYAEVWSINFNTTSLPIDALKFSGFLMRQPDFNLSMAGLLPPPFFLLLLKRWSKKCDC